MATEQTTTIRLTTRRVPSVSHERTWMGGSVSMYGWVTAFTETSTTGAVPAAIRARATAVVSEWGVGTRRRADRRRSAGRVARQSEGFFSGISRQHGAT